MISLEGGGGPCHTNLPSSPIPHPVLNPNNLVSSEDKITTEKLLHIAELGVSTEVELERLPLDFPFSQYLSSRYERNQLVIKRNGITIPATQLIALAFNQVGRDIRKGSVYCMPSRERYKTHACDLVFTNEVWGPKGNRKWDKSNWAERLGMISAKSEKCLLPTEKVIPICLRIFQFEMAPRPISPGSSCSGDTFVTPSCDGSDLSVYQDALELLSNTKFPYSTNDDPAMEPNKYQYSRRFEDISTYLITFNTPTSTPIVCLTAAAEHKVLCERITTPRELSETFRRLSYGDEVIQTKTGDRAQELIAQAGVGSHMEAMLMLTSAFENDKKLGLEDPDQQLFGRVTYLWQEVLNVMEDNRMYDGTFDMTGWQHTP